MNASIVVEIQERNAFHFKSGMMREAIVGVVECIVEKKKKKTQTGPRGDTPPARGARGIKS